MYICIDTHIYIHTCVYMHTYVYNIYIYISVGVEPLLKREARAARLDSSQTVPFSGDAA